MDYNLAVKLCYDICTKYISHYIYFTLYTLESGSLANYLLPCSTDCQLYQWIHSLPGTLATLTNSKQTFAVVNEIESSIALSNYTDPIFFSSKIDCRNIFKS